MEDRLSGMNKGSISKFVENRKTGFVVSDFEQTELAIKSPETIFRNNDWWIWKCLRENTQQIIKDNGTINIVIGAKSLKLSELLKELKKG